nr:EAL domain-containing protein [uncultured Pseudomonas sp.]
MPRLLAILLLCLFYWIAPAAALTLSEEERNWLDAHPVLRLGVDVSWPPFEFVNENGHYQGLAADYIALIETRLGVKAELAEQRNWSEVLELAKAGKLDLLPAVMATPERHAYLAFTRPYLDFPIVILARSDGPRPQNIQALYGLKVAVVENYAPHELLRNQHPQLNLLPLPTVNATLQALASGQADALVGDLASNAWSLRKLRLEGIYISGDTPYRYQLGMATPLNQPILTGILDKLFIDMTSSEIAALQAPWVGGKLERRSIWPTLLLYGVPALLVLIAIIGAVVRINRRLSAEIATRTALEDGLRHSEHHYRSLVENLSAIAWEAQPTDFTFTYVSQHAEKLLGYPLADWRQPGFWLSALHPEDTQQAVDFRQRETAAGRNHSLDYRMLTADGRTLWIRDIVTLGQQGGETVMSGLMIDISEAKQTEHALRFSEQKFASVFQQCPDILVIARHEDGRLIEANKAFEQQTGISVAEAIGKTASELNIWPNPGTGSALLQRLQGESLHNLEMPFRNRDGRILTGLVSAQAFQLADIKALVVTVRDISQLKATQQLLQVSEEKFAKAFHASPDGLLITRARDGLLLEANEGFTRITGYTSSEAANRSTLDLGIWADPQDRTRLLEQLKLRGSVRELNAAIRTRDGDIRMCELSAQMIAIDDEPCLLTIARDITERQIMQVKLLQAATVFESTAEGVMITDTQQRIIAINRAFSEITGYSEAEALGKTPGLLASGQHDSAFYSAMWFQLGKQGHWQGEIWNRRKNGEIFPEWLTINAVRDKAERITHFVGVFADISSLKHAQARLDYQAHHDPLTGLPNRILFETRLRTELDEARADDRQGAVLFIDLDRFKHINDSLGHPVGDQLLSSIATRLKEQLRDVDTVARLGGDEFIILLPGLHQASDAQQVAHKLLACFNQPFGVDDNDLFISASIGISLYPDDGLDVASLVKNADAAMYQSKAKGRNRVELYTRNLTFQATERMAMEQELRRAIERNELCLYYQPKLCLRTRQLVGAEALIRWPHPVFGEIPPDRFIPMAEETGLILQLGDWVLEQACRQMQLWQRQHATFGPLSVNLAGAQLRQTHLFERIAELLATNNLAPHLLQLEITEGFIMNQAEEALAILHQLKALGVQLAIDDFGTGYSSLSYLKRLPLDTLKIDQSFVRGLPDDPNDAAITRAIIALGRSMQLTVIAEGVETATQELFLANEGCEQIQGFVISRPLPADAFAHNFLGPHRSVGTSEKAPV